MCFVPLQLLEKVGAKCSLEDLGQQTLPDGSQIALPPVLLGHLGEDPKKKTLLVYGHLDVQPAAKVGSGEEIFGGFFNSKGLSPLGTFL